MLRWLRDKGFFHLLSANFLTQFLGFGSQLLVARFLTAVELGEIKILQSYTALFGVVAVFGLNTAVLKFCSENRDEQEKMRILWRSLSLSAITTVCALVLLATLALTGLITSSRHLSIWLIVYSLTIPFTVTTSILSVYLQALKRIKEMARAQAWIKAQSFILIVLCTWRMGFRGFVFATIAAYCAGLVPLLRQVSLKFVRMGSGYTPLGFYNIALFSVLANGVSMAGQYTDMFILDHFAADRAAIGHYSLATIFYLGAMQVTATVQSISTPYFSERAADEKWFRRQLIRTQLRLVALSAAVAVATYGIAVVMIPLVYGAKYASTPSYLSVLLIRYVVGSSYAITGVALLGLGLVHYNLWAVAIATPVGLVLSYSFLHRFGVQGVAWAQVCTGVLTLGLVLLSARIGLSRVFGRPEASPRG